jgi:hypothetical protein
MAAIKVIEHTKKEQHSVETETGIGTWGLENIYNCGIVGSIVSS